MGRQLFLDAASIAAVADQFDSSARLVEAAVRTRLSRLAFDGSHAGRVHAAGGDDLRRALDRWAAELTAFSRAGAEIAAALRGGTRNYADAERRAAARVG